MVVAVTKAMEYLKNDLNAMGHECVTLDDRIHSCDAVIYGGERMPEMKQDGLFNSSQTSAGILMINGEHKTAEQINTMLQHRLYSPLFNQTFL